MFILDVTIVAKIVLQRWVVYNKQKALIIFFLQLNKHFVFLKITHKQMKNNRVKSWINRVKVKK